MIKPSIILIGSEGRIGKRLFSLLNSINEFGIICIDNNLSENSYSKNNNILKIKLKLDNEKNAVYILDEITNHKNLSNIIGIVNLSREFFNKKKQVSIDEKEMIKAIKSQIIGLNCLIDNMLKKNLLQNSSIVHIGSLNSRQVSHQPIAYHYLKGAIEAASKSLAYKLAKFNVRSNVILPGLVYDPSFKLDDKSKKIQEKSIPLKSGPPSTLDIANLIYFLISEKSKAITGTSIIIDSGMSLPCTYDIISELI